MKTMFSLAILAAVLFLLPTHYVHAGEEVVAKVGQPVIVKVFDVPMGIEVNVKYGKYAVQYGVLPMNYAELEEGQVFRIRVAGDEDILIRCKGDFYGVTREKTPADAKLKLSAQNP